MQLDERPSVRYSPDSLTAADWGPCSTNNLPRYRFADFFAGLGGFHIGLTRAGHECVFASEIDEELRAVYQRNFGLLPAGDIREIDPASVPEHEVLCAGFPCQPFSLAGKKKGAACPESGKLIEDVFRMVRFHHPKYVLLENVPNVLTIADGRFWKTILATFAALRYRVEFRVYSPLQFGLPQQRYRLFVVAALHGTPPFIWPAPTSSKIRPLSEFIENTTREMRRIEPAKMNVLEMWNDLIRAVPSLSSHTLIASEFGATYPMDGLLPNRPWRHYKGGFGVSLDNVTNRAKAIELLPHYAAENDGCVPNWIRPYVAASRAMYATNPAFFDQWKANIKEMPNSWQKLEWRGDNAQRDIWKHTIQFRASGIRVMRPNMAPSLVAMTPTQTPIIGTKKRYLGVHEAAALQALDGLRSLPENNARAFKALGNAVNAHIVYELAKVALI